MDIRGSMAISDKTRKALWALSGNRCAFCRRNLVVEANPLDEASVVGVECHIVSGAGEGPRYDPDFPRELLDHVSNIVLLCGTHHKLIDDQIETFAVGNLRDLKTKHEQWVESKLTDERDPKLSQVRRFKDQIPTRLARVRLGKYLLSTSGPCCGMYPYYGDDLSSDEIELVGGFFQDVLDWNDLFDDMGTLAQMRAEKAITDQIACLEDRGFLVFSAIEGQRLEGGSSEPSNWNMLHISVVRNTDANIIPTEPMKSNSTISP